MKPFYWILFSACVGIMYSGCKNRAAGQRTHQEDLRAIHIHKLIQDYYQQEQFSGAVLVADKGDILLQKEYGYQDLEGKQRLRPESVFEIASLSKQFTALLIVMLAEDKKLTYTNKLIKYFPQLPYKEISIHHLLTHSSGLAEQDFFRWAGQHMEPGKIYTNHFVLRYLKEGRPTLAFQPGEKWEYSNVGYLLLALIIEKVSGQHYIDVLEEKIFRPLGMKHSGIYAQKVKGEDMDTYAFGKIYNEKAADFTSSFGLAWSDSLYGGVGILSNTADLLTWDRALRDDTWMSKESLESMFQSHIATNREDMGYGYGWFIQEDMVIHEKSRGKRVEHYGLWPGYESSIVRYLDADKTIIILANQAPSVKDKLIEEISQFLFEKK